MESENLTLRAYVRIMDDEALQPYRTELLPLLETPSGCLEVVSATTQELIGYVCQDALDSVHVRESILDLGMIHAVVLG
jgi:hypothetical protein